MNKVSIIVPTYRRDINVLNRAIESLLSQTYTDIEIIIIDDNADEAYSRLNVEKLIKQYLNENVEIVYIKNENNLGGALSRNVGINIASGEYVTFLDDDDKYLPNKIEYQISFMIDNDLDLSFSNLEFHNDSEKIIDVRNFDKYDLSSQENLFKCHLKYHLTGTPTFMYKTNVIRSIGGFDNSKMAQEFYLMSKSIQNNFKIMHLRRSDVIAYRHNAGGISFGKNKIIGEKKLYQYKKQYFSKLNLNDRRYIRFRHLLVLAVAYKRNRQYINGLFFFAISFLYSPVNFIQFSYNFIINIKQVR